MFEGQPFGVGDGALSNPRHWRHLYNPFRPSWGEPYGEQAERMRAAVAAARDAAAGTRPSSSATSCPIWVARSTPSSAGSCTTRASGSAGSRA